MIAGDVKQVVFEAIELGHKLLKRRSDLLALLLAKGNVCCSCLCLPLVIYKLYDDV
jgi:hypothetical protein